MALYADIPKRLHDRVKQIDIQNKEVVARSLKLYLSDQWASEAEQEAQLIERRANWHEDEAARLRRRAEEHEQQAESLRDDAADLRADAESIPDMVGTDDEALGFEEHVDNIVDLLTENPEAVVWPGHGAVETAVAETGASPEAILSAVVERGVDEDRIKDAPLNGGDSR